MATPAKQKKVSKTKQTSSPVSPRRKQILITKGEGTVINIDSELASNFVEEESRDSVGTTTSITTEKTQFVFKDPTFVSFETVCSLTLFEDRVLLKPMLDDMSRVGSNPIKQHSSTGTAGNKKSRVWKNLKQIVAAEKALPCGPDDTTYGMIDAPPSFKPAMKYSDISGLPAKYTDPQTKLRYANAEEFSRIKMMPGDLVTGCLTLRRANIPV